MQNMADLLVLNAAAAGSQEIVEKIVTILLGAASAGNG
jgi:hypothetical protein